MLDVLASGGLRNDRERLDRYVPFDQPWDVHMADLVAPVEVARPEQRVRVQVGYNETLVERRRQWTHPVRSPPKRAVQATLSQTRQQGQRRHTHDERPGQACSQDRV